MAAKIGRGKQKTGGQLLFHGQTPGLDVLVFASYALQSPRVIRGFGETAGAGKSR